MRSNRGEPLHQDDLPKHPDPDFDEWKAVTKIASREWMDPWSRKLRKKLKKYGWRPAIVDDGWRVEWD